MYGTPRHYDNRRLDSHLDRRPERIGMDGTRENQLPCTLNLDSVRVTIGDDGGSRFDSVRNVGKVDALLGANRASQSACAKRLTPSDIPAARFCAVAKFCRPLEDDTIQLVVPLFGLLVNIQVLLHPVKIGFQVRW